MTAWANGDPKVLATGYGTTGRSWRRELHGIRILWQREMLRLFRSKVQAVLTLINPLFFLVLFAPGLQALMAQSEGGFDFLSYIFPGILLMSVLMPAISAGGAVVRDREVGVLRGILVIPLHRSTLLVGKCLGGATSATCQGAILVGFAGLAGIPYRPLPLLFLLGELALVSVTMTMVGAFAAAYIKRADSFQTLLGLAMMPLLLLSGALFPLSGLPPWLAVLALLNPLTYAVDAMRRTLSDSLPAQPMLAGWTPPVGIELMLLALIGLVMLAIAARRFSRTG